MTDKPMPEIKALKKLGACYEAREWLSTQPDWETAWENVDRPDWMLWIAGRKIDCKRLVGTAWKIATDTPLGDGRILWDIMPKDGKDCLVVVKRWIDGDATDEELRAARAATVVTNAAWAAAWAADYAAADAAADAADAAWAAYYAARAAYYAAAADAAYYAAAADAADAAADAAAANAYTAARKWQCDLIRSMVTAEEVRP